MGTVSSFRMTKMIERVETIVTRKPKFENRPYAVLKRKEGLVFGPREYHVEFEKVQIGEEVVETQRPIFKEWTTSPEDINALKSHLSHRTAMEARNVLQE